MPSTLLLLIAGGYVFGSIPFGLILTRLFTGKDIRTIGSGNIGATNVLRTGNKLLAFLTLLLDAGKGILAIAIILQVNPFHIQTAIPHDMLATMTISISLGVCLGHCFPVWL